MSIPGYRVRTAENNKALAERASLVGKAPIPPGLPSAQEIVAAIDGVVQCENFYSMAAQDALARLVIVREQFAQAESTRFRATPPRAQAGGNSGSTLMKVEFAFPTDSTVHHRMLNLSGTVVGNFVDRKSNQQALVEYTGADGGVRREYVDEDLLVAS